MLSSAVRLPGLRRFTGTLRGLARPLLLGAGLVALTLPTPLSAQGPCTGAYRDFDFWIGEWDVLNRNRPADESNWYETGVATDRVYPVAAGCGIVEHWRGNAGGDFRVGFSLRAFNPQEGQWNLVLLWPNSAQPRFGELGGGFRHNRGEFYSGSVSEAGDTTITRFTFSDITSETLIWENGSSSDGGRSWSSGWIMEFSRREPLYQGALLNGPAVTTLRCPAPEHRALDFLLGEWAGASAPDSTGAPQEGVQAYVVPILEGCGVMEKVTAIGQDSAWEIFRVRAYEPARGRWAEYRLDTRWPIIQRLEAETPAAGAAWEWRTPGDTPTDGALRVTMTRTAGSGIIWNEERYNEEAGQWEAVPQVAYTTRMGAVGQGG